MGSSKVVDRHATPLVSHIMAVCLPTGPPPFSCGSEAVGSTAAAVPETRRGNEAMAPDASARAGMFSRSTPHEVPSAAVKSRTKAGTDGVSRVGDGGGGGGGGGGGTRDICVAISGGLMSVLEVVAPLWHIGLAGEGAQESQERKQVLTMARAPCGWGNTAFEPGALSASTPTYGEGEIVLSGEGKAAGNTNSCGFLVMCEGGWIGWYHGSREYTVGNLTISV